MPRYKWTGPETNLGRFGVVKKGDIVNLTHKEEEYILNDEHPHLKAVDEKADAKKTPEKKEPFRPDPKDLPADFDKLPEAEQNKIYADLEQKELARVSALEKANGDAARLNLSEMKKDELEAEIDRMKAAGVKVEVQKGATKPALIAAIKQALGQDNRGEGGGEETGGGSEE
jgi:hypothetical protein